ncbi:MAG TPA: hypothetical protein VNA25_28355, partial [Phycisphaerae bacterium]|nr:hypothetical protein [Phycisphaerae bacterium]
MTATATKDIDALIDEKAGRPEGQPQVKTEQAQSDIDELIDRQASGQRGAYAPTNRIYGQEGAVTGPIAAPTVKNLPLLAEATYAEAPPEIARNPALLQSWQKMPTKDRNILLHTIRKTITPEQGATLERGPLGAYEKWGQVGQPMDIVPFIGALGDIGVARARNKAAERLHKDYARMAEIEEEITTTPSKRAELETEYRTIAQRGAADEAILLPWAKQQQEAAMRGESFGATAGTMAANMIPYMLEISATGGLAGVAGKGARGLVSRALLKFGKNKMWSVAGQAIEKGIAKGVGVAAKAATYTALNPQTVVKEYEERALPQITIGSGTERAQISLSDEKAWPRVWKSAASGFIEYLTEMSGDAIMKSLGAAVARTPGLRKLYSKLAGRLPKGRISAAEWHGYLGEFAEEELGGLMRGVLGTAPDADKRSMLENIQREFPGLTEHAAMALVFALPTGAAMALRGRGGAPEFRPGPGGVQGPNVLQDYGQTVGPSISGYEQIGGAPPEVDIDALLDAQAAQPAPVLQPAAEAAPEQAAVQPGAAPAAEAAAPAAKPGEAKPAERSWTDWFGQQPRTNRAAIQEYLDTGNATKAVEAFRDAHTGLYGGDRRSSQAAQAIIANAQSRPDWPGVKAEKPAAPAEGAKPTEQTPVPVQPAALPGAAPGAEAVPAKPLTKKETAAQKRAGARELADLERDIIARYEEVYSTNIEADREAAEGAIEGEEQYGLGSFDGGFPEDIPKAIRGSLAGRQAIKRGIIRGNVSQGRGEEAWKTLGSEEYLRRLELIVEGKKGDVARAITEAEKIATGLEDAGLALKIQRYRSLEGEAGRPSESVTSDKLQPGDTFTAAGETYAVGDVEAAGAHIAGKGLTGYIYTGDVVPIDKGSLKHGERAETEIVPAAEEAPEPETAAEAAEEAEPSPETEDGGKAEWGEDNKYWTREKYEKAKKRWRDQNLYGGTIPGADKMKAAFDMGMYHFEALARHTLRAMVRFKDWRARMRRETALVGYTGDTQLKRLWRGMRDSRLKIARAYRHAESVTKVAKAGWSEAELEQQKRTLRGRIMAVVATKGLPQTEWREIAKQHTGHQRLTAKKMTIEDLESLLKVMEKARPRQIGAKKVIRRRTEQKIQSLKTKLLERGELTEADFARQMKELRITHPGYKDAQNFTTETQGHELIRAMNDEALVVGLQHKAAEAIAKPGNEGIAAAVGEINTKLKTQRGKAKGPGRVGEYQSARYYAQRLEELTGAPFLRVWQALTETSRANEQFIEQQHARIIAASPEAKAIMKDREAAQRVSDYIASKLKHGARPEPEGITAEEIKVAEVLEDIFKEMQNRVRTARVLDHYHEKAEIPDAPPAELRAAVDAYESGGLSALEEYCADKTWGVIGSGYEPEELTKTKMYLQRPQAQTFGKGHLQIREAPPVVQARTIFQRTDSYLRQVMNRTALRPYVASLVRLFEQNQENFARPRQVQEDLAYIINEAKGYPEPGNAIARAARRLVSQAFRGVFIRPWMSVRNLFQNLAFNEDFAQMRFVWQKNQGLTAEDQAYFNQNVDQMTGLSRQYMMLEEKPLPGLKTISKITDKLQHYPLADRLNRQMAFWLRMNRIRRATGIAYPGGEVGVDLSDAAAVKKMMSAAGMDSLEAPQKARALEILAESGP